MRLKSITIADTYGTTFAKITFPSAVMMARGANGTGKSSIANAIIYGLSGGGDATVLRRAKCVGKDHLIAGEWNENAECGLCAGKGFIIQPKSVIEYTLEAGEIITKTTAIQKPKKDAPPDAPLKFTWKLEAIDSNGIPIPAPQTWVNELFSAFDPGELLKIDATTAEGRRKLSELLLKLMPLWFEVDDIQTACTYRGTLESSKPDTMALATLPEAAVGLDGLKKISAQVTELRRRTGQTKEDSDGAVNRMRKSLPEDNDDVDYGKELEKAEQYQIAVNRAVADAEMEVEKEKASLLVKAQDEFSSINKQIDDDIRQKIAELQKECATRQNIEKDKLNQSRQTIVAAAFQSLKDLHDESSPKLAEAAAEISKYKERLKVRIQSATIQDEIARNLKVYREAAWKYEQLSAVLSNIEKMRAEKLNGLPVQGLVVEDGVVTIDGIPWHNVNKARIIGAVIQICTQRAGKIPLLILDDVEHLDNDTRKMIEEGLAEAGFQVLEAMVDNCPLKIEEVRVS